MAAYNLDVILGRLAELFTLKQKRELTYSETLEFNHCLQMNQNYYYCRAKLEELSYQASETNDMDWQHEICARIEELEETVSHHAKNTKRREK